MTSNDLDVLVLCSDLDRTLIPNGAAVESPQARPVFKKLSSLPQVILVYATGRSQQLVKDAIKHYGLPTPDFVIGDVGASIYRITDGKWQPVRLWEKKLSHDWQGKTAQQLQDLITPVKSLVLQPQDRQRKYKLSYFVNKVEDMPHIENYIEDCIQQHGYHSNCIYSVDEIPGQGMVDILPRSANKLLALEFLQELMCWSCERIVFAGDSGNDMDILCSHFKTTLVANATEQVRQQVLTKASKNHRLHKLYLAKGLTRQLNGNYAAGVVEGCYHYYPELIEFIRSR